MRPARRGTDSNRDSPSRSRRDAASRLNDSKCDGHGLRGSANTFGTADVGRPFVRRRLNSRSPSKRSLASGHRPAPDDFISMPLRIRLNVR